MTEMSLAASAHDRGYDSPQSVACDPTTRMCMRLPSSWPLLRPPRLDKLGLEDVRTFQVHLVAGGMIVAGAEPDGLRGFVFSHGVTLRAVWICRERIPVCA